MLFSGMDLDEASLPEVARTKYSQHGHVTRPTIDLIISVIEHVATIGYLRRKASVAPSLKCKQNH